MSLFRWIFDPPRFRSYEDSFAQDRSGVLAGLRQAIASRASSDQTIILVAHFADVFTELQKSLEVWETDYEIVTSRIDATWLENINSNEVRNTIFLCLSELMSREHLAEQPLDQSNNFGVLVVERYPLPCRDQQLEQFCRALPGRVELGYFLSFEDAVLRRVVDPNAIRILKMFGMGENELVTSNMISRRLKIFLQRNARSYTTDYRADSAEEWFERNSPELEA